MSKVEKYLEHRLINPDEKIPVKGGGYVYLKDVVSQHHQSRLKEGLMNFAEHWNDDNIGFECTRITSEEVEEYFNKLKQE